MKTGRSIMTSNKEEVKEKEEEKAKPIPCQKCYGTGWLKMWNKHCNKCDGKGVIER